jgi:hypothetical protein
MLRRAGLFKLCLLAVLCESPPAVEREVTTLGTTEVTAQVLEIPGSFPANDLYNYAYVVKYPVVSVHRGQLEWNEILVAHYNPLKPRSKAHDEIYGNVGGHLQRFHAGDIHRMALQASLDQYWMGGVIDKYHTEKGQRYWAVRTNLETK